MFTEQPAQPHPIAEVQVQPADATASPAPGPTADPLRVVTPPGTLPPSPLPATSRRFVSPLPLPKATTPGSASHSSTPHSTDPTRSNSATAPLPTAVPAPPQPTPVPASSPLQSSPRQPDAPQPAGDRTPTPTTTPTATAPPALPQSAKTQRLQEVEQALLELTQKARAKQAEQQAQQAAQDAAKYGEAADLDAIEQLVHNPALPANVKAALEQRIQAKLRKKGITTPIAKPNTPSANRGATAATTEGRSRTSNTELNAGRDYSTAPFVPFNQAQLQVRLGQLFGRNLNFAFPLSIPAPITSLFGWRIHPISGTPRFHQGIDFGAPEGTPILAAKAGRVEVAGAMDGYGLAVVVQHGRTLQTLYGHMSQLYVQPGETVKKGQLLGLVGSTGNSTGPHLHFEVHELTSEGWMALDPAIALNGAIALAQNGYVQATSTKPRSFNLALSGLLDIHAPTPIVSTLRLGNSLLAGLRVPASVSVPVLPELSWLLSPLMDDWMTQLSLNLPGFAPLAGLFSLNPVPTLTQLPPPRAFDPTVVLPTTAPVQVAKTKPLTGLTIADQIAGLSLKPSQQRPLPMVTINRDRVAQVGQTGWIGRDRQPRPAQ